MTGFADNLYLGAAKTGVAPKQAGGYGFGPVARCYIYDIVPLALNASALAASQSPSTAAVTLSAGTGVTAVVNSAGQTVYQLDVPRAITVTSGGNDTGIAFLISGYDFYGAPMTQLLTGASGAAATTTKAFYQVASVVPNGAVASTVTVGTADVFGLPVCAVDAGYIAHAGWSSVLTANAGTFVAAVTATATSTTGDVRGTYAQSGAASNGTNRLVLTIALSDLNIGTGQTVAGVLGVTQA